MYLVTVFRTSKNFQNDTFFTYRRGGMSHALCTMRRYTVATVCPPPLSLVLSVCVYIFKWCLHLMCPIGTFSMLITLNIFFSGRLSSRAVSVPFGHSGCFASLCRHSYIFIRCATSFSTTSPHITSHSADTHSHSLTFFFLLLPPYMHKHYSIYIPIYTLCLTNAKIAVKIKL